LIENEGKVRRRRKTKTIGKEIRQFTLSNWSEKNTISVVGGKRLSFTTKLLMLGI
jgi:hypothetical protein